MSDSWDAWMCGLSGLAFFATSSYTLWKYNTYSLLMNTPHLSLSELFAAKDKYLYRDVFLYGKASASPAIKVPGNQSVTSDNYSKVIYSNYTSTRMNQQGFTIDQTHEKSSCYFKLGDNEGQLVDVRPTRDTLFIGYDVFKAAGFIELSWTQIFKSTLGFLTFVLYRAIPFTVASRYESVLDRSNEELIPNGSFVYVQGRVQQALEKLFMFPSSVTLSFEELVRPLLRRMKVSASLQVLFGISFAYFALKILRRRWQ